MRFRSLFLALALLAAPLPAPAHHGLTVWDEEHVVTIEGFVSHELTGFPHWEIKIRDENGDDWKIDLGNGFEMERAGLKKDGTDLPIGTKVRVEGVRPRDSDTKYLRPSKIITEHKTFLFEGQWN